MPPMPRARTIVVASLAVLLTACASSATTTALWKGYADHPPGYLAAGEGPVALAWLPPPPDPASPRGLADAFAFSATRALKDGPRWSLAARDAEVYTPDAALSAFACALDADIRPATTPALARLLGRLPTDIDSLQAGAKKHYGRKRPFVALGGPICVPEEPWLRPSGSYPSGHSATGWAWALILAQLAPDRAAPVLARGAAFGDSRVICGVHYPSDVEAGRQTGAALVAVLQSRPDFQADLDRARAELAAARKVAPRPDCAAETAALAR
ncbi:MAG: phosphatase PAP2 family protein [Pseudomonadota bacterium]